MKTKNSTRKNCTIPSQIAVCLHDSDPQAFMGCKIIKMSWDYTKFFRVLKLAATHTNVKIYLIKTKLWKILQKGDKGCWS